MKKFVLASVFVVAASSVFAAESAKQKPTTTTTTPTPTTATTAKTTPSESYFSKAWSKCPSTPAFVVNAKNTTTAWMKENPWKSAAVVAVITVLTVKAIDYALTNEDEEAGF